MRVLPAAFLFIVGLVACGDRSKTSGDAAGDDIDGINNDVIADTISDLENLEFPTDGTEDRMYDSTLEDGEDAVGPDHADDRLFIREWEEEYDDWEGVQCGYEICYEPQLCCWDMRSEPATPSCTSEAECSAINGFIQRCDSFEDCGSNENCCCSSCHYGDFNPESYCMESSACERLCHTNHHCSEGEICCGFVGSGGVYLEHCYAGTVCPP